jgi:hypothetical protein
MFAPGDQVHVTRAAALIPTASTQEQELSGELSIPGRRWLREACVAASAEAVVDSMEEAEAATVVDAKLIR